MLELLRYIGHKNPEASDEMNDLLAQIATNTESNKNTGNTILYECVRTIMNIEASQGLRVLAINILGRFLMNRENNVRYVALKSMQKVVDVDYQAVSRHKNTIMECIKDHDLVIKKKALDLIYQISNQNNVKSISKDLMNFLLVSDNDFKNELAVKICMMAEKHAPNKKWYLDTIVKVLTLAGNNVKEEYIGQCIAVVASTPELQAYTVSKVFFAMKENTG